MKKLLIGMFLIVVAISNPGCIVVNTQSTRSTSPPLTPADSATVSEINAAGKLDFEASRLSALTDIARRPMLTPAAQLKLVEVAYTRLSYPENKVALLRAIIANPSFVDTTRQAIVEKLQQLPFDSNREAVLAALNERVSAPPVNAGVKTDS